MTDAPALANDEAPYIHSSKPAFAMAAEAVCLDLHVSPDQGLDSEQIKSRQLLVGFNQLRKRRSFPCGGS